MRPLITLLACLLLPAIAAGERSRPNLILVMADDQGWGQVGYNGHPHLKTPHLDAMAAAGLRLDRFYAAGPVCSPTRASVLTGRTPNRTGVPSHGWNLRPQEKTLSQALQDAGYATGHFGKWHLNGVRGPGVPVLGDDPYHPGRFGFDEWLSVTNFYDRDPLMSRQGRFEAFDGDSSEIAVAEALEFIARQKETDAPFFAVIWYGSPHSPWIAAEADQMDPRGDKLGHHLGEIVAIDRSVGALRRGLRELGIENDTLVWYCSDNGGLTLDPGACGDLKGHKGDVHEGGIRVPGIIEWPGRIEPATTDFPASTMDMMPTIVDLLGLPEDTLLPVRDGESILALLDGETPASRRPIPFVFQSKAALIDGNFKIVSENYRKDGGWKLYDLKEDPGETTDLAGKLPQHFGDLRAQMLAVLESVEASVAGKDYPEGRVTSPARRLFWYEMEAYEPHFETFFERPEYSGLKGKVPESLKAN